MPEQADKVEAINKLLHHARYGHRAPEISAEAHEWCEAMVERLADAVTNGKPFTLDGVTDNDLQPVAQQQTQQALQPVQASSLKPIILVSPVNGSTLTGNKLEIVIKRVEGTPLDSVADIHLSTAPQPASDLEPRSRNIDDSDRMDSDLTYEFENIPENGEKMYGRVYFSCQKWADKKTLIADGNYIDFEVTQNKKASTSTDSNRVNKSGMILLPIPERDISEKDFNLDDWTGIVGKDRDFWEANDFNHTTSVTTKAGKRALRARLSPFPGRENKPSTRTIGGLRIKGAPKVYRVSAEVYVQSPFSWGGEEKTGKIALGIAGKVNNGTPPSGGKPVQDGMSERIIWDGDGDLSSYSYDAKTKKHGDRTNLNYTAPLDEWFELAIEVSISSAAGAADGRTRIFIDGDEKMDRKNITFFGKGTPVISRIWLTASMGGNNSKYTPTKADNYIYFANLHHGPGSFSNAA